MNKTAGCWLAVCALLLSFAATAAADDLAYIADFEEYYDPYPFGDPVWQSGSLYPEFVAEGYTVLELPGEGDAWLTGPLPSAGSPSLLADFPLLFTPEPDDSQGPIRFNYGAVPEVRIQVWTGDWQQDPVTHQGSWVYSLLWTSPQWVSQGRFETDLWAERWRISVAAVPEPCSASAILCGALGLGLRRRRTRQA